MRLLFDENLSSRLVPRLAELFPDSTHVRDVGLQQSPDEAIWDDAQQHGFILVTADHDFRKRVQAVGPPPQVVFIERCGFPLTVIEDVLRQQAIRIQHFAESNNGLLILRR